MLAVTRIEYDGKVSTPGADLTTIKCLLNSVISTVGARFMAMDIKDFYLNNPMNGTNTCEYPSV